ncbi:unnamed protein product [Clonostachys byssicola]|uniref:Uncharacterized protein n=1 Tax=Clonostachys byssicola TaxID=160290 RepID=A0A9N9Y7I7_9HYPO|nr:unnamed protein product [Clonostachys byssicola]
MIFNKSAFLLALVTAALGAPSMIAIEVPEQDPAPVNDGRVVINVFGGGENDTPAWPTCRPDGTKCKFNSSCCSGYCSWHGGYKCAPKKSKAADDEM